MDKEKSIRRARTVTARTVAIIGALPTEALRLFGDEDIRLVSSRYQVFRGIVYDLVDGAYMEGYCSGEDQAPSDGGAR